MGRPWWHDDYWKKVDWRQERRMRTTCPFCGSDRTYYNDTYKTWKCLKCEKSFVVEDLRPTKDAVRARKASKPKDELVEHWERQGKSPTAYKPSKVISRSSRFPGWLKPILTVAILVMFTVVVWGLWGSKIAEFFSGSTEEGSSTEEQGSPPSTETDLSVFEGRQPPFSKTWGERIHLINNKYATDPTWEQLVAFLIRDSTDQKDYSLFSYPCGAFAEEVHNNAEVAGIRVAWVAIDFEDDSGGHALNAFNTSDKGLVFVDCTSSYRSDIVHPFMIDPVTGEVTEWKPEKFSSYDRIAYVEVGKEYGLISLDVTTSPEYSFYEAYLAEREKYESKLEAYNQELETYIQALGGRVYLYEPEYSRFMEWYNRLNSMRAELEALLEELGDSYWDSLGVVSNIEIYW